MRKSCLMKKITIRIMKDGFIFSSGAGNRKRKDASTIYNWTEQKLGLRGISLASRLTHKTAEKWSVVVLYPSGGKNETTATNDSKEILFALAAFLEDYLSKLFLKQKYKMYGGISE